VLISFLFLTAFFLFNLSLILIDNNRITTTAVKNPTINAFRLIIAILNLNNGCGFLGKKEEKRYV
jgi:hypothetical protein